MKKYRGKEVRLHPGFAGGTRPRETDRGNLNRE